MQWLRKTHTHYPSFCASETHVHRTASVPHRRGRHKTRPTSVRSSHSDTHLLQTSVLGPRPTVGRLEGRQLGVRSDESSAAGTPALCCRTQGSLFPPPPHKEELCLVLGEGLPPSYSELRFSAPSSYSSSQILRVLEAKSRESGSG